MTIMMTIVKRGGEDHRDNYDDNSQERRYVRMIVIIMMT